jgi:IKI3 family
LYKDTLKLSKAEAEAIGQTSVHAGVKKPWTASKEGKINSICDAFLAALKNKLDTNLQNTVTAHVCKSPPDLDAGLQLVADLRGLFLHFKMPSIGTRTYANQLVQCEIRAKQKKLLNICVSWLMPVISTRMLWEYMILSSLFSSPSKPKWYIHLS